MDDHQDGAETTPPTGPAASAERTAAVRAEIKAAMEARGWSQPQLARESGVSLRSVNRIITGNDYAGADSILDVQRALGIGQFADPDGRPPLHRFTSEEMLEELLRRLKDGEAGTGHPRITRGPLPDDVLDSPDVRTSPPRRSPRKRRQEG